MKTKLIFLVAGFLILSTMAVHATQIRIGGNRSAQAQQAPAGPANFASSNLNATLDKTIQDHFDDKNLPGLTVLYARDGLLVYKKNLGFADIESQTAINENNLFRLASVSKLLAAAICLRAEQQGQINLNSSIRTYLPEIPAHHNYKVIDLLSCRSGVRHYSEPTSPKSPSNWGDDHYTTALAPAKNLWHDPLKVPTGSYHYSTHGYTILGAALEMSAGKTIGQIIDQSRNPLGMPTLDIEDPNESKSKRVSLYALQNASDVQSGNVKISRDELSWKVLGGGLECSAMDLLRFGMRLVDGQIISQSNLNRLKKRIEPDQSYALGCNQAIENGLDVFAKNGGQPGASSYIWCIPERRMVMVVLVNRQESGGAAELGKKLRNLVINSDAASGKSPDLVVREFKRTGNPVFKNGNWEIAFSMKVANAGQGPANNSFVNGIRLDTSDTYRWSGFINSLAPNGVDKELSGVFKIPDAGKLMAGRTMKLIAMADAPIAAADTSISPQGRIEESNEANNSRSLSVSLPGGVGNTITGQAPPKTDASTAKPSPTRQDPPPRRSKIGKSFKKDGGR